ncbi:MAG: signal peptidase I [Acidimicrobiia bacterium]
MAEDGADGKSKRRHPVADFFLLVLVALAAAWVLKTFVAQAFYIPSGSMQDELEAGDRVIVSKLAYQLHDPRRGDIVVFPSPEATAPDDDSALPFRLVEDLLEAVGLRQPPGQVLIKRIVALPGETVEGRGGDLVINGRALVEPYLEPDAVTADFPAETVPAGSVFVMGDNRLSSRDSRVFGPVPTASIVGRAVLQVWPPTDASFL